MIKLKQLLSEIALVSGDASSSDMKDMFDTAFKNGILPKKYKRLYYADSDEAKGIAYQSGTYTPSKKAQKETEKLAQLNQVTPDVLKYVDKYQKVGSSGNYVMILRKSGKEFNFLLCDKTANSLTEFFIGVIKAEQGANTYNFTPTKAFNLKTYQIHWSNIAIEHKGSGLGRMMYKMVYDYITGQLGAALVSDSMLFQGSQKMWMQFVPTFATYFGIVVGDVFYPIERSEIGSDVMGGSVEAMVAMEKMPTEIRKIAYNVKGLSFKRGEYGTLNVRENINKKLPLKVGSTERSFDWKNDKWEVSKNKDFKFTYFTNLVDEARTIYGLIKEMEKLDMSVGRLSSNNGNIATLKACIFSFSNANVIIKQGAGKLIMVTI